VCTASASPSSVIVAIRIHSEVVGGQLSTVGETRDGLSFIAMA
jgi:hypothetical protein